MKKIYKKIESWVLLQLLILKIKKDSLYPAKRMTIGELKHYLEN